MNRQTDMTRQEMRSLILKMTIRFSLMPLCMGLFIYLPAGTFNYWQAHTYLASLLIPMIFVLMYFLKRDPQFLERRTHTKEKEKHQTLIVSLSTIIFLAAYLVPGLDKRFGWSHVPIGIVIAADAMNLLGYALVFFVFNQNSYASRVVEIDKDQKVVSTGLYGIVRHPMYLGVLIMFLPMPLGLGSYWGLAPVAILPMIIVQRIINEEKTLKTKLPGYVRYCRKVRHRLIPFLW
jgi:protein-S-isoprenylcysteine O-methyltransferase Ste14